MEVDAVTAVGPVEEERVRLNESVQLVGVTSFSEPFPPLRRADLAEPIGGLVPGQAEVADGRDGGQQGRRENQPAGQPPAPARTIFGMDLCALREHGLKPRIREAVRVPHELPVCPNKNRLSRIPVSVFPRRLFL